MRFTEYSPCLETDGFQFKGGGIDHSDCNCSKAHILGKGHGGVIATPNGVRRGDDGAASLEGCHDPRLRDGNTLLLHGLVDAGTILVIHLDNE